jgi:3'(2'), 5'-bisphosphate nucleotidase
MGIGAERPIMTQELARLLDVARRAARAASIPILDIYQSGCTVRQKVDASPVTAADEAAERVILAALDEAAPHIPVVAEEHCASHGVPKHAPDLFWLVDPLDGTKEFISRNGEFTVNIALIDRHRPILGVVHVPVTNVTYAAAGPGTATRQIGDGSVDAIAARTAPATGAIIVHSRSHADEALLADYIAGLPGAQRLVSGSSIKFCLLAAAEADHYPRFGPTMEWDTAAGHAVLDAAGGRVDNLDGTPLRYGKPGFLNPGFIARDLGGERFDLARGGTRRRSLDDTLAFRQGGGQRDAIADLRPGQRHVHFLQPRQHDLRQLRARRHAVQHEQRPHPFLTRDVEDRLGRPEIHRRGLNRHKHQLGGAHRDPRLRLGMRRAVDHDDIMRAGLTLDLRGHPPTGDRRDLDIGRPGWLFPYLEPGG